jgi:hypothetical protein
MRISFLFFISIVKRFFCTRVFQLAKTRLLKHKDVTFFATHRSASGLLGVTFEALS